MTYTHTHTHTHTHIYEFLFKTQKFDSDYFWEIRAVHPFVLLEFYLPCVFVLS